MKDLILKTKVADELKSGDIIDTSGDTYLLVCDAYNIEGERRYYLISLIGNRLVGTMNSIDGVYAFIDSVCEDILHVVREYNIQEVGED